MFNQLGEALSKIKTERIKDLLPVDLAYKMRNIIAHDYLGIDMDVIYSTINEDIPNLKGNILKILKTN